jgi:calcineurin-like phosphoesterase family protein
MPNFYTSDQHFGHTAFQARPGMPRHGLFKDTFHMDSHMIECWNSVVAPGDTVYHLGDLFVRCSPQYAHGILYRLNGDIILILGNHDKLVRKNKTIRERIKEVHEGFIEVGMKPFTEQKVTLCHYKMQVWNKSHYGSWHCYGHSHSGEYSCTGISMNVCCDLHNFIPLRESQVASILKKKEESWVSPFGREKKPEHF